MNNQWAILRQKQLHGEQYKNINRDISFYADPIYRPPPQPTENLWSPKIESKTDASPRIDLEFKENSLYQKGIISETYQRTDKSYFQELKELENLVNMGRLVQKFLSKQADIDKIFQHNSTKST